MSNEITRIEERLGEFVRGTGIDGPNREVLEAMLVELEGAVEELRAARQELAEANLRLQRSNLELAGERRRFEALFEFAPDPFMVTDARGLIKSANRAAAAMLGRNAGFLHGKPMAVYIAQDDKPAFFEMSKRIAEGLSATDRITAGIVGRDGRSALVRLKGQRMGDQFGVGEEMLWNFHDIGDLQRTQGDLAAANERLERTLRALSHDIKGPISAVQLGTSILGDLIARLPAGDLGSEIEDVRQAIYENSRVAMSLIRGLLELRESVPGTRATEVDVTAIVHRVLVQHGIELRERGMTIDAGDNLGRVRAIPVQIHQLFSNLVANMIEHDDDPEPRGSIAYVGLDEKARHSYIVADNGRGIPARVVRRMASAETGGRSVFEYGMGLEIVTEIVRLYDGAIDFHSDGGTEIRFSLRDLPLDEEPAGPAEPESDLRLLLVEDEKGTAYMLSRMLSKKLRMDVDVALTLEEARERLATRAYSALLLDYRLADGTGLELLEEVGSGAGGAAHRHGHRQGG